MASGTGDGLIPGWVQSEGRSEWRIVWAQPCSSIKHSKSKL